MQFRAEHDRQSSHNELNQTRTALDQLSREKVISSLKLFPLNTQYLQLSIINHPFK